MFDMTEALDDLMAEPSRVPFLAPGSLPRLRMDGFGLTDRGLVRPNNEDHFLVADVSKAIHVHQGSWRQPVRSFAQDRGYLMVVADGMGGRAGGERASRIATERLERLALESPRAFFPSSSDESASLLSELEKSFREVDATICSEAQRCAELRGMGTTITLAYAYGRRLYFAHVGDSRCYLFRDGFLHQLTTDHSVVQEMLQKGMIEHSDIRKHAMRHVITNFAGGPSRGIRPATGSVALQEEDIVLLCSDGLTDMLDDDVIAGAIHDGSDPRDTCRDLVELAIQAGGKDNITVVVGRYYSGRDSSFSG